MSGMRSLEDRRKMREGPEEGGKQSQAAVGGGVGGAEVTSEFHARTIVA